MTPRMYAIVVEGELGPRFDAMFADLDVERHEGETTISGPIADQAQLRGVLDALDALGVSLVSVTSDETTTAGS